jgi:hypothetical protein
MEGGLFLKEWLEEEELAKDQSPEEKIPKERRKGTMVKPDFLEGLEWQLEVEEEGIRNLKEKGAPEELIREAKVIRDRTAVLVNSFKGPATGEPKKQGHSFVKFQGGWLIGDE